MSSHRLVIGIRNVPRQRPGWEISDAQMPQAAPHCIASFLLWQILDAWAPRVCAMVYSELALRWEPTNYRVGLDPDLSVYAPPPPDPTGISSVRTWEEGHEPPKLAVEIVSPGNPNKDYFAAPEKYAASGTGELWVFDPLLEGPKAHGGPFRLQLWVRQDDEFVRTYAGDGPAFSPYLKAWLVPTDEGRKLRIADDQEATSFWLTSAEASQAREAAALARVAELEAQLAKKA